MNSTHSNHVGHFRSRELQHNIRIDESGGYILQQGFDVGQLGRVAGEFSHETILRGVVPQITRQVREYTWNKTLVKLPILIITIYVTIFSEENNPCI